MALAKELIGLFLMGFFCALLILCTALFLIRGGSMMGIFSGISFFSIILLYFVDIKASPKVVVKSLKGEKFRYCYNCGAENHRQARQCYKCGSNL